MYADTHPSRRGSSSVLASRSASWRYLQSVASSFSGRATGEGRTKIDPTLELLARVGQWVQGRQCLLEARHGIPVGRVGESLGAGLPEVRDGLLPHLAPEGMVSQARHSHRQRAKATDRSNTRRAVVFMDGIVSLPSCVMPIPSNLWLRKEV